jgi:glycosyltransferase involved in cell wall biosynthesis
MARVSIIIPAYNAQAFIASTIKSVLASSFADFEVIVIDDGSTDQTAARANVGDERVRVIQQANAGMSASRNRGVALSKAEFIAFLDSDDEWHPLKLQHQLAALDTHPDHDICFSAFQVWQGEEQAAFFDEPRAGSVDPALTGWIYPQLILDNHALPSSVLMRRKAWDQLGPFLCENQQTDDWEYLVRASTQHRFVRLAEKYVLYRQHPESLSKRMPLINGPELMREALIRRFGLAAPDGRRVDERALQRYRHQGWVNFADGHCARGDLGIGLKMFAQLLARGPFRKNTVTKFCMAIFRRFIPKHN